MQLCFFLVVMFAVSCNAVVSGPFQDERLLDSVSARNSSEVILKRNKRFLIFTNGGVAKFVGGYLGPIDIPLWQNINCMRNYQMQYMLPAKIYTSFSTFPYSRRFNEGRSLIKNKDGFKGDSSRKVAYKLVETVMNKEGKNGRQCLLRTICEVAETPLDHNGLIGELLHIFFNPGDFENVDEEFKDAKKAGEHGVNCAKLYNQCPFGDGFLDKISVTDDFSLAGIASTFL